MTQIHVNIQIKSTFFSPKIRNSHKVGGWTATVELVTMDTYVSENFPLVELKLYPELKKQKAPEH